MRHRIYGKHLGRDKNQRQTLFKGLIQSLLIHGTIQTSEAKAKAVKGLVDKVINLAKDKKTQRMVNFHINNISLTKRLIEEITPKLSSRNSGYTSLTRMGTRPGDQTMMVKMSLIGVENLKPIEKVTANRSQGAVNKTENKSAKENSENKLRTGRSVRKTKSDTKRNSRPSK